MKFLVPILQVLLVATAATATVTTTRTLTGISVFEQTESETKEYYQATFFLAATICVCYILIFTGEHHKNPLIHQTVTLLTACVLGAFTNVYLPDTGFIQLASIDFEFLLEIVMPLLIFKYAFVIDAQTFFKYFNEILVMSFAGIVINSLLITGLIIPFFVRFQFRRILICGLIYSTLAPIELSNYLNDTVQSRDLVNLLEGERILGSGMALFLFKLLMAIETGLSPPWFIILFQLIKAMLGGFIIGFIIGKCLSFIFRASYENIFTEVLVTLVAAYLTYYVCEQLLHVNGVVSVSIVGILTNSTSTSINSDIENMLKKCWETISGHLSISVLIIFGVNLGVILTGQEVAKLLTVKFIFSIIAVYVNIHVARFLTLVIISPILVRLNTKISWRELLIAVWFNYKDTTALFMGMILMQNKHFVDRGPMMILHLSGIIFVSNFFNGLSIKGILAISGLSDISASRILNMNMCLQYISSKKDKVISVLKMSRLMSDVNWPVVIRASTLSRPYQIDSQVTEIEHEVYAESLQTCQNCRAAIVHVPSPKEIAEFKKEVSQRILIAKKTSYNRHFEEGTLSKTALLTLVQAVDAALYSDKHTIDIASLSVTSNKQSFNRRLRGEILSLFQQKLLTIPAPKSRLSKYCYDIVSYAHFNLIILSVISINTLLLLFELAYPPYHLSHVARLVPILFNLIYFVEFCTKILAFSHKSIFFDSFRIYLNDHWNKLDFVTLILCTIDIKIMIIHDLFTILHNVKYIEYVSILARSLRTLRLLRLLTLAETAFPKIVSFIDYRIDKDIAFIYDIGKGFVIGEEEITEAIQLIENGDVKNELKMKSFNDRLLIMKELAILQKNRPIIIKTVKTQQAIHFVLHNMSKIAYQLKNDGVLEKQEFQKIMDMIHARYKFLRDSLVIVDHCPPDVIFKELLWVDNDDKFAAYIYRNVKNRLFDTGDIILTDGDRSAGIFIIISGLFKVIYRPNDDTLREMARTGFIPVVDNMPSLKFYEHFEDYILPGNTIGELSMITQRSYNCTVVADMPCQVYFLAEELLKYPTENISHVTKNLESKIWKMIASKIAHYILMDIPTYQSFTNEELSFIVERAFVPSLERFATTFVVSDMIKDILLIYGTVSDTGTKEVFTAPCYIPRNVRKFELYSGKNKHHQIEPKLLIIPSANLSADEIMDHEYEISHISPEATLATGHKESTATRKKRPKRKPTARLD